VSPEFGAPGKRKLEARNTDRARAPQPENAAKLKPPPAALPASPTTAQVEVAANWPLLLAHEVSNCPSAQTLAVLQQRAATQPPAPHALAIFADPVFGKYDERVQHI